MPFDRAADLLALKEKLEHCVINMDAVDDPGFTQTYDPTFKYGGKRYNFAKWMVLFSRKELGTFDEANIIEEHYYRGFKEKNIGFWPSHRSIAKTMYGARRTNVTSFSECDVLKIALLSLKPDWQEKWLKRLPMTSIEWGPYD